MCANVSCLHTFLLCAIHSMMVKLHQTLIHFKSSSKQKKFNILLLNSESHVFLHPLITFQKFSTIETFFFQSSVIIRRRNSNSYLRGKEWNPKRKIQLLPTPWLTYNQSLIKKLIVWVFTAEYSHRKGWKQN